jgi:nucleoside-diphosphate-sugar epimerase
MILVTGGAGFIGSAVARRLLADGYSVRIADDLSKGQIDPADQTGCEFLHCDLRLREDAERALKGVDVCYHLAARIGGIAYFHRYPATILSDNNLILTNVFTAAARQGTKVVYVSSSMVFESTKSFPTPESALMESPPPMSHYGFSKLVGEYYSRAFHAQYGLTFIICRPFNAYGPGEYPEDEPGLAHVIPDLIKKTLAGDYPLEIIGSGRQERCFTYVDDVAEAICLAGLDPRAEGDDFNIGIPEPTSIRRLARLIWERCGRTEPFRLRHLPDLPHDVQKRIPDVSKIEKSLGWRPKVRLAEGLDRTIAWYKEHHASQDRRESTPARPIP